MKPLSLILSLAIVVVGLAGKAVIDKALALQGGAAAVGLWGQIVSLASLLSGISISGLGSGLAVVTARAGDGGVRRAFLVAALLLGLGLSGIPLLLLVAMPAWATWLIGAPLPLLLVVLASFAGWLEVIPGMVGSSWQGSQQRAAILGLTVTSGLVSLLAIFWSAPVDLMQRLVLAQGGLALTVGLVLVLHLARAPSWRHHLVQAWPPLWRYIWAGVAIGPLSHLSSLVMRSVMAAALSWQEVGMIQAQWRVTDWITTLVSGLLAYHYLPRLSATHDALAFRRLLGRMAQTTLLPGLLLLALLYGVREPVLSLFYQEGFSLPAGASLLFLAGDGLRTVAWLFLHAMFARGQTMAIALGDFLSLPLFALMLLLLQERLTTELAGLLWLITYGCYAAFNAWIVLRKGPSFQP